MNVAAGIFASAFVISFMFTPFDIDITNVTCHILHYTLLCINADTVLVTVPISRSPATVSASDHSVPLTVTANDAI